MKEDQEDASIKKFTLGVVNYDKGALSKVLLNEVFAIELKKEVGIKFYKEAELAKKIKDHQLEVGIIIKEDFTSALLSSKETKVKLLTIPDPGVKAIIVQSVIEQFARSIPIVAAQFEIQAAHPSPNLQENNIIQPLIKESTISKKTKPVSSFQYYAAAMGVMFLLMTIVQGVSTMIQEKEQDVFKRLLVTHLTYPQYLFGKMLGLIVIGLIQAFIIIIGTKIIYGVEWGSSVSGIVLMTFAFVINASGLGVLAGSLISNSKSFEVAGMFGTQLMAALGGSMAPLYIFPDWVIYVTKILPNGLALQTYLDLMTGATLTKILPAVAGSIGLGLVFFSIGLFRFSSERRRNYA
jgi:ABC-2 type transport system permease protein